MAMMGVTFGGTIEQKLEVSFQLFDEDGNGELDEQEIKKMLELTTKAFIKRQRSQRNSSPAKRNVATTDGENVEISEQLRQQIDQIVKEVLAKIDVDGNGTISLEEFKQGFSKHPDICAFFRQF